MGAARIGGRTTKHTSGHTTSLQNKTNAERRTGVPEPDRTRQTRRNRHSRHKQTHEIAKHTRCQRQTAGRQMWWEERGLIQICTNLEYLQMSYKSCTNMYKSVQICTNMYKYLIKIQIIFDFSDSYKYIQITICMPSVFSSGF